MSKGIRSGSCQASRMLTKSENYWGCPSKQWFPLSTRLPPLTVKTRGDQTDTNEKFRIQNSQIVLACLKCLICLRFLHSFFSCLRQNVTKSKINWDEAKSEESREILCFVLCMDFHPASITKGQTESINQHKARTPNRGRRSRRMRIEIPLKLFLKLVSIVCCVRHHLFETRKMFHFSCRTLELQ